MSEAELAAINAHEDAALFREAVQFTAAESGFIPRLIEKDYFCTLLLAYLSEAAGDELVFKGGTCLTKVHSELYRLSEDLDYTIPVAIDASRAERRRRVELVRAALDKLTRTLPSLRVVDSLRGANNSKQYLAVIGYNAVLSRQQETIKIEVSLREPLLVPAIKAPAQTILRNPLTNKPMVMPLPVRSIDKMEALAEKFRAALSRREPAIRDFFDIDYAVRKSGLRTNNVGFIDQVGQKLAIPGNDPVDVSEKRREALSRQIDAELKSVLRDRDFAEFDLDRAFEIGVRMAKAIPERG
jgi:predicted nucleotidyltransferase component of viral defense system